LGYTITAKGLILALGSIIRFFTITMENALIVAPSIIFAPINLYKITRKIEGKGVEINCKVGFTSRKILLVLNI
jgi:hypothetical protein